MKQFQLCSVIDTHAQLLKCLLICQDFCHHGPHGSPHLCELLQERDLRFQLL